MNKRNFDIDKDFIINSNEVVNLIRTGRGVIFVDGHTIYLKVEE